MTLPKSSFHTLKTYILKFSIRLKSSLATIFYCIGGVTSKLRRISNNDFVILMYHRVITPDCKKEPIQAGMYVEPDTFRLHLQFLKKHFQVISFLELSENLNLDRYHNLHKPLCILTFDDGWLDFYQNAFPLLKEYQVPATVFLPTNFVGTHHYFWTDRLALSLYHANKKMPTVEESNDQLVNRILQLPGPIESRVDKAIKILKDCKSQQIEQTIAYLISIFGYDQSSPNRMFINWQEAREMNRTGVVSFGSHTANHEILTSLDNNELGHQIVSARVKLIAEKVVDQDFIPFCYPNGNYNTHVADMVKAAGYQVAVTTDTGWNNNHSDVFALKRIGIHQDMASTVAMYACRIVGML